MATDHVDLSRRISPLSKGIVVSLEDEEVKPRRFKSGFLLTVGICGLVVGGIVGRLFPPFVLDDTFWRSFLTSAGFGGVMAVIAACIAYMAARHAAKSARALAEEDRKQRKLSDRKEQWWARAEWALNQVASGDSELGFRVLDALGRSEWAEEHEADVIAAAADDALTAEEFEDEEDVKGEKESRESSDE